jgi:hypothetical protein
LTDARHEICQKIRDDDKKTKLKKSRVDKRFGIIVTYQVQYIEHTSSQYHRLIYHNSEFDAMGARLSVDKTITQYSDVKLHKG